MGILFNNANEAASKARSYQANADSAYRTAMTTANSAVLSAQANQGTIANYGQSSIQNALGVQDRVRQNTDQIRGTLEQSKQTAAGMTPYINEVGAAGQRVTDTAQSLTPYADQLSAYAKQLAASGDGLRENGAGWLQNADALMNLDPNAGGLIGKTIGNVNAYDPNQLVSLAASDVQQSYDNARGQLVRNISRTGGSTTSGNALALQADLTRSLAAALAGAKTRTRISGIREQTNVLRGALADAMQLQSTGNATVAQGNAATQGAANATASAAGVVAQKGQLEATGGNLAATAANLTGTLAGIYDSIAQIYGTSGSQLIAAGNLVNSAYGTAASTANTAESIKQGAYGQAVSAAAAYGNYNATQASENASLAAYLNSLGGGTQSTYEKNQQRNYTAGSAHTVSVPTTGASGNSRISEVSVETVK